jgi:hypothetical protein
MSPSTFTVCYRGVDGAWVPFMNYGRRELAGAVRSVRSMAHQCALKADWCLKRGRKVILRLPRGRAD